MNAALRVMEELESYQKEFPGESEPVRNFVDFLHRNGAASFDRALSEGHFTASCWLLDQSQSRVLLTHHKKLNIWVQLGGHADGETDPRKVALTEAREESGIEAFEFLLDKRLFDIDRHVISARKNEAAHFHYDLRFAMSTIDTDDYKISDESHDLRWVNIANVRDYTRDESVIRMATKWLSMI